MHIAMHGAPSIYSDMNLLPTGGWVYAMQVTVRDTELQQEMRVINSGERDLSFTAALHSYFRVGDITQVCAPSCILLIALREHLGHPVVDGQIVSLAGLWNC